MAVNIGDCEDYQKLSTGDLTTFIDLLCLPYLSIHGRQVKSIFLGSQAVNLWATKNTFYMPETKEAIRKHIYDYINNNVALMTTVQSGELKKLILAHDQAESKNDSKAGQRLVFLNGKLNNYLAKAKTLPLLNLTVQTEVATLKLVASWLNENIEENKTATPSSAQSRG